MTNELEPIRYDSMGVPVYAHQVADRIDADTQHAINRLYSELGDYNEDDVKALGRAVI